MRSRIAALVVFGGVAIRVVTYVTRWGMWQDETLTSLNIGARSPLALMRPLDYDQTAPIGFLWGEWLVTRVAGMSVWALHAFPLLLGIALLIGMWVVGRRLVGPDAALVATAFAAVSGLLVSYANLVKPYGTDALVTLVLIGLAAAVLRSPQSRSAWTAFAIGAVAAPWFSTPSIFVLAGATLALLTARPMVSRRYLIAATAAWIAMEAVMYRVIYAAARSNLYFRRYWAYGFLQPNAPQFPERVRRALLAFVQPLAEGTFRSPAVLLGLVLVVAGLVVVARRYGVAVFTLLLAPCAAVVGAAVLGIYPIHSRLVLFCAPLLFFAAGAAAAALVDLARPSARPLALAAVLGVVLLMQRDNLAKVAHRTGNDNTPILIGQLQRLRHDEPVYLVDQSVPGWIYYTTNWRTPDTARLGWYARLISSYGPAFTAIAHRGRTVHDEGDAFCELVTGREDLVGLGSGEEDLDYGLAQTDIDEGWADNEARRMAAAAHPDVLVLGVYTDQKELGALHAALDKRGAVVTWSATRFNPHGEAFRVRFPARGDVVPPVCAGPPT